MSAAARLKVRTEQDDPEALEQGVRQARQQIRARSLDVAESELRETLHYYYYDVAKSVEWLTSTAGPVLLQNRSTLADRERAERHSPRSDAAASKLALLAKGNAGRGLQGSATAATAAAASAVAQQDREKGTSSRSSVLLAQLAKKKYSVPEKQQQSWKGATIITGIAPPPAQAVSSSDSTEQSRASAQNLALLENVVTSAEPSQFAAVLIDSQKVERKSTFTFKAPEPANEAFSQPSPDDTVTRAQQNRAYPGKVAACKDLATSSLDKTAATPNEISDHDEQALIPKQGQRLDIAAELLKSRTKQTLSMVVVGHVDTGKSTLMGRLLWDANEVDDRVVEKFKRESSRLGKGSFALAWVLDQTDEERQRGVTIDVSTRSFSTDRWHINILDTPGHKDFVPNMIAGACMADIALLVVSSAPGEFESGFTLNGQTREHGLLIRSLGLQRVIVAVNKLDTADWSEARFNSISTQMSVFLAQIGYSADHITFIPCSGLTGGNVLHQQSPPLSWYSGPTLVSAIDNLSIVSKSTDQPFRFSIADIQPAGKGLAIYGTVQAGSIQSGDRVLCQPSGMPGIVRDLGGATFGVVSDSITINLLGVDIAYLRAGDVLCDPQHPVNAALEFVAQILLFEIERPVTIGTNIVIYRGRVAAPAQILNLISQLDKQTGKTIKSKPRILKASSAATVLIRLKDRPMVLEPFKLNKDIGRFIIRRDGDTIGAGVVNAIVH